MSPTWSTNPGRIRPIIVRFSHYKDRQIVWKRFGHKIIPPAYNKFHVREDFPEAINKERAVLQSVAHAILNTTLPDSQTKPRVFIVSNKLLLNNRSYTVDTLQLLPDNLRPASLYTPMTADTAAYYTENSPLSNHNIGTFKKDGVSYNCGEQYISSQKAKLFKDPDTLNKIMNENHPVKQKQLCKNIKNFDNTEWENKAEELITPGLHAKFSQCKDAKDMLQKTGSRLIVEANPYDTFLGGGVHLRSNMWKNNELKGRNMMGKILMSIRTKLNR